MYVLQEIFIATFSQNSFVLVDSFPFHELARCAYKEMLLCPASAGTSYQSSVFTQPLSTFSRYSGTLPKPTMEQSVNCGMTTEPAILRLPAELLIEIIEAAEILWSQSSIGWQKNPVKDLRWYASLLCRLCVSH